MLLLLLEIANKEVINGVLSVLATLINYHTVSFLSGKVSICCHSLEGGRKPLQLKIVDEFFPKLNRLWFREEQMTMKL